MAGSDEQMDRKRLSVFDYVIALLFVATIITVAAQAECLRPTGRARHIDIGTAGPY